MRTLIRIVFVIFIAKGIDCLGKVCDDCCDCFKEEEKNKEKKEIKEENKNEKEIKENEKIEDKKNEKKDEKIMEYEEIEEDEINTAKSLVNDAWYNAKENKPIVKIFKKEGNNDFQSKDNGDKISIKSDEKGNPKITYQNLEGEKYAFFEIKPKGKNTVYLYCSDVESRKKDYDFNGIFENMDHISISVIACDTEKVTNMNYMFFECSSLKELDLNNFNTTNVKKMTSMFNNCSSLINLDLQNFNTEKVTDMGGMFCDCSSLKEINFGQNFNTTNVTDMHNMFSGCSNLKNLDLNNFDTQNVEYMENMFYGCSSLTDLKFGDKFNTEEIMLKEDMFSGCNSFPENIRNNLNDVEGIINFFKEKNKQKIL